MDKELHKNIYIKYREFIKNDLLYFEDLILNLIDKKKVNANTVESYFDSTITDENEIAVVKIKENYEVDNKFDILKIGTLKYIVGFLYPSEYMNKEDTYNFNPFWIYTDGKKKELRLSSFTIFSDVIIKKNNKFNKFKINFDKENFDYIEDIIIIKVIDLINSQK
jgi:predicted CopG family antitoxin